MFATGSIDPWHALGTYNDTIPLVQTSEIKDYILGTAHCKDLYAPAANDPESLTYARSIIADNVAKWLQ